MDQKQKPQRKDSRFQPGQSGNPGGRPKGYAEFRELCRDRSPKALATLDAALDDGDLYAVRVVLEYAWGKPASSPEDIEAVKQSNPFSRFTLEELRELASRMEED